MNPELTPNSKKATAYPLRIPRDLRQLLEASAEKNQRSLNGEIVFQLKSRLQGAAA